MSWTPKFTLDLQAASKNAFDKVLEDFETWRATQKPRKLDLTNGWKTITPEIAEGMLLRNPIGANRKPTLPTVKFYAQQMLTNAWKKTGQPILFDDQGALKDLAASSAVGLLSRRRHFRNLPCRRRSCRRVFVRLHRQLQSAHGSGCFGNRWPQRSVQAARLSHQHRNAVRA